MIVDIQINDSDKDFNEILISFISFILFILFI
jgi:hypothetical protein